MKTINLKWKKFDNFFDLYNELSSEKRMLYIIGEKHHCYIGSVGGRGGTNGLSMRYKKQYVDRSKAIFGADKPTNQPAFASVIDDQSIQIDEIEPIERQIQAAFIALRDDKNALFTFKLNNNDPSFLITHLGDAPTFLKTNSNALPHHIQNPETQVHDQELNIIKKLDIAKIQLDRAIDLFLCEKDFLCSITLAGAAEEILGKHAIHNGISPFSEYSPEKIRTQFGVKNSDKDIRNNHLNYVKNELKHFNDPKVKELNINLEGQAIIMLSRACINFKIATGTSSFSCNKFLDWINDNRQRFNFTK